MLYLVFFFLKESKPISSKYFGLFKFEKIAVNENKYARKLVFKGCAKINTRKIIDVQCAKLNPRKS